MTPLRPCQHSSPSWHGAGLASATRGVRTAGGWRGARCDVQCAGGAPPVQSRILRPPRVPRAPPARPPGPQDSGAGREPKAPEPPRARIDRPAPVSESARPVPARRGAPPGVRQPACARSPRAALPSTTPPSPPSPPAPPPTPSACPARAGSLTPCSGHGTCEVDGTCTCSGLYRYPPPSAPAARTSTFGPRPAGGACYQATARVAMS